MNFGTQVALAEASLRRTRFVTEPTFYIAVVFLILSPWYFAEFPADLAEGFLSYLVRLGRLLAPLMCAAGVGFALLWIAAVCQRWQALRIVRAAQL